MKRALVLGGLLILAGIAAAVMISVPRIVSVGDRIDGFPKTRLSEGAVQLTRRAYDVYIDVPSDTPESGWTLAVFDADGREVPLRPTNSEVTYDLSGRSGVLVGKVRVTLPGRHLVRGTGPPGARVIFADDVVGDVGKSILLAILSFLVLAAAGVAVIVIALARRGSREPKTWP